MANQDNPNGFTPHKHGRGGVIRYSEEYTIASGLAANIFSGDPVKMTGTGRNITVCAAGDTTIGIFAGCRYTNAQGEPIFSPYWATGTVAADAKAMVYDDPSIEFEVQADGAFVEADVGNKADFVAGTGNTRTGRSAFELDSSDIGTGDGLLILGLVDRPDNAYGTNAKVRVLLREHALRGALTAV